MSAALRPFFSFYGAKWRIARTYPAPAHDTIKEPFAGSAGYSLRYPDRRVELIDIDPVVAGVWGFLIRASSAEVLAIPDVPLDGSVDDLRVCQEARWLVGFWLNRAPSAPRKHPSAWMRSGVRPGSFWGQRVRHTIARQLDAIRHWRIVSGDFREAGTGRATWFVDPPYEKAGRHYVHGAGKINFAELGAWCTSRPGQVIVCEQEGAGWLPFRPHVSARANHSRVGEKRSPEAVFLAGEVLQ